MKIKKRNIVTFAGALSAIAATSVAAHADVNGSRSGQFDVTEQTTNTTETTRPKQTVVFFVEVSSVTDVPGQRLEDMREKVKPLWDNMIPGDRLIFVYDDNLPETFHGNVGMLVKGQDELGTGNNLVKKNEAASNTSGKDIFYKLGLNDEEIKHADIRFIMDSLTTTDNEINKNTGLKEFIQAGELLRVALKDPGAGLAKSFQALNGNTAKSLDKIGAKYKIDDFSEVFDPKVRLSTIHKTVKTINEQTVSVSASNNDIKISNVQVVGPDGKVVAEGSNNIKFKPEKPGKYTVKYNYTGTPTGSTTLKITANGKEIDTHTVGTVGFNKKYVADESLPLGTTKVRTPGKPGTIDGNNKVPAVDEIVAVGTKPKVDVEDVSFATKYQGNANLRAGIQNILKQGKTGTKTTTTTYTLKSETSDATDTHVGKPVVVAGEDRLIEVGIKPETTVTNLPFDTEYKVNYTKKQGTPDAVIRKGVNGSKTTTTTFTLDEKSGLVSRQDGTPTVVNPTNEIIEQYKGRETKYVSGGKDIAPSVIQKDFDMKKAIKSFIFEDEDISGVTKTYNYVPELTTKHVDTKTGKELAPSEIGKKFGEKREFDEYEFKGETVVGNVKTYSYYKGPKIIQRFFNPQGEKVKPDYTIYNRKVGDIINVGHPWGIDYKGVRLYPTLSKLPNEVVEVKDQDIIIDYIYDKPVPGEPNVPLATESNTLSVKNTCPPQHVVGAKKLPPRIVIKND